LKPDCEQILTDSVIAEGFGIDRNKIVEEAIMKRYFWAVLVLLAFFSQSHLFSFAHAASQPFITLSFGTFAPPGQKGSLPMQEWCKEVEKRTNGRVKMNYYPGGTLAQGPWLYDAAMTGIADVAHCMLSYTRGTFPVSEVIDLPLGGKSGFIATKMMNDYYKNIKPKEFDQVKILWMNGQGPTIIHTQKPVIKLEDLKGMKIRTTGLGEKIITALGGAAVSMPMAETYDALQKGVVEGVLCPIEALFNWRLGEVVKYSTESYGSSTSNCNAILMSRKKWNTLPADIQQIIEKINDEWVDYNGKFWDQMDQEGREYTVKRGNKVISLSKEESGRWAERVKPLLNEYVNSMKAKGLPGAEALQFCTDYIKANQK
jgi:TRAP-type C4-dicarboxylate transport system substrate-binding protein